MTFSLGTILVGVVLLLIQLAAALPWLAVLSLQPGEWKALLRPPYKGPFLSRLGLGALAVLLAPVLFGVFVQSREGLETSGMIYGALLQAQLIADFFVVGFALLLAVWPK